MEGERTPLYNEHIKLGGKIASFAGWLMPLWYKTGQSIEHHNTRKACGLFDICHMGEFDIQGKTSQSFLSNLLSNSIDSMEPGQAMYNFMLNKEGGVVDDCILYCFNRTHWMLVVNAGNIKRDFNWMKNHTHDEVRLKDISNQTVKIDLQGPNAPRVLSRWIDRNQLENLRFFRFLPKIDMDGISVLVSRTGYTGEIGFELYTQTTHAVDLWKLLLKEGKSYDLLPCGLGARDTLRTEAGLPLYGHELKADRIALGHPLMFAISWEKSFIGKEILVNKKKTGVDYYVVPFKIDGKRKAMPGWEVLEKDMVIGSVLSGVISPSLNNVPIGFSGTEKSLDVGSKLLFRRPGTNITQEGEIVQLPFIPHTSRKKIANFL